MHVLRAEKGYIIVGQDTDGTVTPEDAGLAWAIGRGAGNGTGRAAEVFAPADPAARTAHPVTSERVPRFVDRLLTLRCESCAA